MAGMAMAMAGIAMALGGSMAKIHPTSMIFDVVTPGRKYGQNRSQKHDCRRFGPFGGSMAKIDPRSTIFDGLDS